jgi:hypothetical protein
MSTPHLRPHPLPSACHALTKVYAEAFGTDITSAGAAGYWEPYKLSDTPQVAIHNWGKATFDHLQALVHSPDAPRAGVSMCYATSLFRQRTADPFWADIVGGYCRAPQRQLQLYSDAVDWADPCVTEAGGAAAAAAGAPAAWVDGYSFNSLICEGR